MNTRSLTFRLIVWYAGCLTVLFIVFSVFVYASLSHYLKRDLREALARRVRQVADLVQRSPPEWEVIGREMKTHFAPEANNRFTRVTANGLVTYVAGPPADLSFNPELVPPPPRLIHEVESFARRTSPDGKFPIPRRPEANLMLGFCRLGSINLGSIRMNGALARLP